MSPGKHPIVKGWLSSALPRDEAFKKWPNHKGNWGVIPFKSGFIGIDIDVKGGKNGQKSLEMLQNKYGKLPDSMVIKTPSGGFHILFQYPDEGTIPNSNSSIADGIDIRGSNGYLVAVGSIIFDKKYSIFKNDPIEPLPDSWLPVLLSTKNVLTSASGTVGQKHYSLPKTNHYASQSEADFALAGRMKAAGQCFEKFCLEIKKLRRHDNKSRNQKYLQRTWANALETIPDDGKINLIGFERMEPGNYVWHCTRWCKVSPYGKPAFRFDGIIINAKVESVTLPLFVAAPNHATGATKLAKIWRRIGDGTTVFDPQYLINKTYIVKVSNVNDSEYSKVDNIISEHPEAQLSDNLQTIR